MSRVTISMKAARALLLLIEKCQLNEQAPLTALFAEAELRTAPRRGVEPKRKPRKRSKRASPELTRAFAVLLPDAKAQKRDRRASIREAVVKRAMDAGGLCECGCGEQVRDDRKTPVYPEARGEMDHFWGRGKGRPPESLATCWFLRPACHLAKTRNQPDAATWLERFITHCSKCGYDAELRRAAARRSFVETRSMLGAGLRRTS